jgi:hypothetical protein
MDAKPRVMCQDDDSHGYHEAGFSYVNEYGHRIYSVACDGYIEHYDECVVEGVA